jgi:hypothetical protein
MTVVFGKAELTRMQMIDLSGNGVVNTDLLGGNKTCIRVDMNSLDDLYSE